MALTARRIFFTVLVLHIFLSLIRPIDDPDIWWHLKTGQHIIHTLRVPRTDIYSYTAAGKEWIAHEWLSQTLMYITYSLSGWIGLIVFSSLVTAAIVLYLARHCDAPPQIVLVVAIISEAAALVVLRNPRPRLATLLFTAVVFIMLRTYIRDERKRLWLLPIVIAFWVNLHAGYPLGLLLILLAAGALVLDRNPGRARHVLLVFALCVVAVTVNPQGVKMFAYPFATQFSSVQASAISEWNAPDFNALDALPFLFLILTIIAVLGLSKKSVSWFDLLCLMLACFLSLRSKRHVSVLSVISIPILAEHSWHWLASTGYGERIRTETDSRKKLMPALLVLTVVIVHLPAVLPTIRNPVSLVREPVRAVRFLEESNLPNNVFSTYEWNDYLIWNAPSRRVFIDGRADMYGDEFLAAFVRLYPEGDNWETIFERFGVRTVMIEVSSPVAALIRNKADWSEVYQDDQAIIFTKK
jgi:hypothetical protein